MKGLNINEIVSDKVLKISLIFGNFYKLITGQVAFLIILILSDIELVVAKAQQLPPISK
jgi:hypothetical protein